MSTKPSDTAFTLEPSQRHRRLRSSAAMRRMVQENDVRASHLIYPLFVRPGKGVEEPIKAMPGQSRWSVDLLARQAEELSVLEVPAVLLFGVPEAKDATGSSALSDLIPEAIQTLKAVNPELLVITDICLCAYTDHGHCGLLQPDGEVDNDLTLPLLAQMALHHAQAGADMVAPSAMMDGQVGAIRGLLDAEDFENVGIMAYAAKFASSFYGPFREAAGSAPSFGDRKSYQMNPANGREALREMQGDLAQGADILMVKPGLPYLDVLRQAKDQFNAPMAVYNVSGEYAMIKAAAQSGWLDERKTVLETMLAFRRAGADLIITYHAKDVAGWLKEG